MKPQDLLLITIKAEASRQNSDFVDISHRGLTIKAKVEYGDFRQITKSDLGDRDIQDEISFLNAEVSFVAKGDKVTHNGIDYIIEHFSIVVTGIYNIFAIKKVRTGSML